MKQPASVLIAVAAVVAAAALLVGCAESEPETPPSDGAATSAATAVESAAASPSPSLAQQYEKIEFSAEGGPTLRGRIWSEGPIGVILAHGFSRETGQDDWNPFAEYLAGLGYGVLTFDFRGFCDGREHGNVQPGGGCSQGPSELGENWRDAAAAVEFLRSRGSERIFIVGASMGGIAAFRAADEAALDLAGIVSLATPQYPSSYYGGEPADDVTPERLQRIAAPKLFIAGDDDVQLPPETRVESVRFADDARAMFEASPEPRALEILDSIVHSSSLVTGATPEVLEHTRQLIVAFIEEHA